MNMIFKVYDSVERATEVSDDRLKALYVYKADEDYKATKKAEENAAKLKTEQEATKTSETTNNTNNTNGTDATGAADQAKKTAEKSDISISVSLGTSKSESSSTSQTTVAEGSSITGGNNVNITATKEDIKIKGSTVEGENITLDAKENIEITASENTNVSNTDSKSSSATIGASINLGDGSIGGLSVSGSKQTGEIKENSTTYNQSAVTATDNLTMKSGKDTNIIGSKVEGETVKVTVGENLNLESLQDKETYDEKNSSVSGTIGVGTFNASASKGKINSDYQSVTEQAEIHAGKGGFDIEVGKNTDLKGAVISSDATADKNKISTDTLTYSDIENKADYGASSKGVNYSNGGDTKYNEKGLTPNIDTTASGSASSTTKSAVANGTIEVKSNPNQDLSGLSRDTTSSLNQLGKIFDKETVQEQQELANLFGKLAFEEVHKISKANGWDEGSPQKIALHAFVGGIMSDITGSGFTSGAVGAGVNEAVQKQLEKYFKNQPDMWQWASALIGAAASQAVGGNAQTGASTAVSGTKNNELRVYEFKILKENLQNLRDQHLNWMQKAATLTNNSATDALNTIMKYNGVIADVSAEAGVPNEMVQAILFREQIFYNVIDSTDVGRVESGISKTASIGIGQIFPSTAIKAEKEINGSSYTEEEMFQRLQDDRTSIYYVAIILAAEANRLGADLSKTSDIQRVLAKYNGTGDEAAQYGKETFQYYEEFQKYNRS